MLKITLGASSSLINVGKTRNIIHSGLYDVDKIYSREVGENLTKVNKSGTCFCTLKSRIAITR